jgi:hypothetical protein
MKCLVFGAWVLIGVAACNEPTRPAAPSIEPQIPVRLPSGGGGP